MDEGLREDLEKVSWESKRFVTGQGKGHYSTDITAQMGTWLAPSVKLLPCFDKCCECRTQTRIKLPTLSTT